jgi:hypothetical protein
LEIVSTWLMPSEGEWAFYARQMRQEAKETTEAAARVGALHPEMQTIVRVRRGAAYEVLYAAAENAALLRLCRRNAAHNVLAANGCWTHGVGPVGPGTGTGLART